MMSTYTFHWQNKAFNEELFRKLDKDLGRKIYGLFSDNSFKK